MSPTDTDIVARAKAGDEEAFRMLVERHSRAVFRLAYRIAGNEHDAEEAVQETFLRVFRSLDRFRGQARFETWLYRVASNAALDVVRRRQRHQDRQAPLESAAGVPLSLAGAAPNPERLTHGKQVGGQIAAAMKRLTPSERAAFTLRHLQGLSIGEIGEALGLRSNAVKNAIFRAVKKMRQDLAPIVSEIR